MSEENISQEFRPKNVDETKNYLIKEINQNELMIKNHKKVYIILNCFEHLPILISTVSGCVSISAFTSLIGISIKITNSAIALKICLITPEMKKNKSIIKKKKRKHYEILPMTKYKLNSIEVLISKALINLNISPTELVLINKMLKEFDDIKKEIKNSNDN